MSLSIVVLTWNDWKNTVDCLQSILKSINIKYDIILVDNNSDLKHINFIKKWHKKEIISNRNFVKPSNDRFNKIIEVKKNQLISSHNKLKKNIFLIKNKVNYGLTKGLNIGYKFALLNKYKYILRIDNDMYLKKDCIFKLVDSLKYKNVAAVSPKILHGYTKNTIWWDGQKMNWGYLKFHNLINFINKKKLNDKYFMKKITTDSIAGAFSAYKASSLKASGLGDEEIFYGPEDIELSTRLKKSGQLIVNNNAVAYHKIARSESIAGLKKRTYQSTYGFLILIKRIGSISDKVIGYSYFIVRLVIYKLLFKSSDYTSGYFRALKDFFITKNK